MNKFLLSYLVYLNKISEDLLNHDLSAMINLVDNVESYDLPKDSINPILRKREEHKRGIRSKRKLDNVTKIITKDNEFIEENIPASNLPS